jgi:electron transport complex protein RnfG
MIDEPAGTARGNGPVPGTGSDADSVAESAPPPPRDVPAWRLMLTLAVAGALAGLVIVSVFGWAEPRIEAHRAEVLRAAIDEVLGQPERTATLFRYEDRLLGELPAGVDSVDLDRVYVGFDGSGNRIGFAITGEQPGYQDFIRVIFGYQALSGELRGMKVLESKETPGLGDKIEKDTAFVGAFVGVLAPIEGVKEGDGTGDPHEVDLITGATISSRTVISIINDRLEVLRPLLDEYVAQDTVSELEDGEGGELEPDGGTA